MKAVLTIFLLLGTAVEFCSSQHESDVFLLRCYSGDEVIPGRTISVNRQNFTGHSDFSFRLMAALPAEGGYNRLLMGDCNHNGLNEFIYRGEGSILYFVEKTGGDVFSIVDSIAGVYYIPLAVGDLDNDGFTDMVVQEGNYVRVLESVTASAFPKTIQWSHILNSDFGEGRFEQYAEITDLDRDGRNEILMTSNTFPLMGGYGFISIFEKVGNNNYARKFYYGMNYENSMLGSFAVGDFDSDNNMEFACAAGIRDTLYLFEAVSDDSFQLTHKIHTGLRNQYTVIFGNDLDNDARNEIIVSGDDFTQPGYRNIKIYEPGANDVIQLSNTIVQYTGLVGYQPINTGNLLQTGNGELVLEAHRIFVYGSSGNNIFVLSDSSLFYSNATNTFCYDISPGGLDELQIVRTDGELLVFDNPALTGIEERSRPKSFSLFQNYPNPFNSVTKIRFQIPFSAYIRIAVFDILGREVSVLMVKYLQPGVYEIPFDAGSLPSGIYVYKLYSDNFSDVKLMVLAK
jgi:hypothetical protein